MDFKLSHRLKRAVKSVLNGLTIIRDNGLSLYNIKDLVSTSAHLIDYVELNTSALCSEESLLKRVDTYTKANITPYISGTMSEAYYLRNNINEYLIFLKSNNINFIEISDEIIDI